MYSAISTLSVIALTIHIIVYTSLKKMRTQPAQNMLALAVALALGQFLALTGLNYRQSHSICVFIATGIHFFYLVAAFWMNVMCFDICRSLFTRSLLALPTTTSQEVDENKGERAKRRFKAYSMYAWGLPVLIVSSGHVVDQLDFLREYRPSYATAQCFLNNRFGIGLFFALPIASLLLENFVLFFVTVFSLCQRRAQEAEESTTNGERGVKFRVNRDAVERDDSKKRLRFVTYSMLGLFMCLAWTGFFVAIFTEVGGEIWYLFILFDGLQVSCFPKAACVAYDGFRFAFSRERLFSSSFA